MPGNRRRMVAGAGGGGGGPYTANATNFDGTNDFIRRTMTGVVDGEKGILSFWLNMNGGDGGTHNIFQTGNAWCEVTRLAGNNIKIAMLGASASAGIIDSGGTIINTAFGWAHILASWNLSGGFSLFNWYINDVQELSGSQTVIARPLNYSSNPYTIGAHYLDVNKINACLSEFYFNQIEYIDLSITANRRKFIDATGKPVNLGSDGSTPTGTQPIIYLPNPFGTFHQNAGSNGDFTVTGALTVCASAP